jgi:hypothetical protein
VAASGRGLVTFPQDRSYTSAVTAALASLL